MITLYAAILGATIAHLSATVRAWRQVTGQDDTLTV